MGLPKVQAISRLLIIFAINGSVCWVLGSKYEGCPILCERSVIWLFLFFQRKKERMTLSAIHLDGGENFRLYMGLLQHHSFSLVFFFNFNKKWMIAGVQE